MEEKQLKGPLATACKSIQLQIDKYQEQILKWDDKIQALQAKMKDKGLEIEGLKEQIKRLKGE